MILASVIGVILAAFVLGFVGRALWSLWARTPGGGTLAGDDDSP